MSKIVFLCKIISKLIFLSKNRIGFAMTNQFSKSFIIIFGEIMCVFDCWVSPVENMTIDFFAFYHIFLMAFLLIFSQSESHLHYMSTDTSFGFIVKFPDVSEYHKLNIFILPCNRCILPAFNSALQKAGEKNTHVGHQCSYIGLNFDKIVWNDTLQCLIDVTVRYFQRDY